MKTYKERVEISNSTNERQGKKPKLQVIFFFHSYFSVFQISKLKKKKKKGKR